MPSLSANVRMDGMSLLRLAFGNWFSRAYLILVALVALVVTVSLATSDGPDANLIGVWLFFVTAPGSMIGLPFAGMDSPGIVLIAGCVVGALLNATVIGLIVRAFRRDKISR